MRNRPSREVRRCKCTDMHALDAMSTESGFAELAAPSTEQTEPDSGALSYSIELGDR